MLTKKKKSKECDTDTRKQLGPTLLRHHVGPGWIFETLTTLFFPHFLREKKSITVFNFGAFNQRDLCDTTGRFFERQISCEPARTILRRNGLSPIFFHVQFLYSFKSSSLNILFPYFPLLKILPFLYFSRNKIPRQKNSNTEDSFPYPSIYLFFKGQNPTQKKFTVKDSFPLFATSLRHQSTFDQKARLIKNPNWGDYFPDLNIYIGLI